MYTPGSVGRAIGCLRLRGRRGAGCSSWRQCPHRGEHFLSFRDTRHSGTDCVCTRTTSWCLFTTECVLLLQIVYVREQLLDAPDGFSIHIEENIFSTHGDRFYVHEDSCWRMLLLVWNLCEASLLQNVFSYYRMCSLTTQLLEDAPNGRQYPYRRNQPVLIREQLLYAYKTPGCSIHIAENTFSKRYQDRGVQLLYAYEL